MDTAQQARDGVCDEVKDIINNIIKENNEGICKTYD